MQYFLKKCCKSTFCSILLTVQSIWKWQPPYLWTLTEYPTPEGGGTPKIFVPQNERKR